jgi:hypothetical protein
MAKSSIPQVKIVDCTTGEEIVRDFTTEEIAQREIDIASGKAFRAELEAKSAEKQALLDRLGITAEQAKLLLG